MLRAHTAEVAGDGNCGYYSALASGGEATISHCLTGGEPTVADYAAQKELRKKAVAWLLDPAQVPLCEQVRCPHRPCRCLLCPIHGVAPPLC